ncbi:MAG: hypothetical protein HN580_01845 [Deltaproteobacteria bacterium]|nr:hypothetical protein [Deltaproteobacteria bacterium]MBT4640914.1 hypothetical protein [Deltaproteobacteria bacterium]MBT6498756.1 hypothetical protein [Deltaproteobacteria bacterium]MBT7156189.1 hypothetical protein [Deltaproteobacteria bacterium]MBT7716707.1 hypothetical protein [Deltaproteobacteria bacterium]
MYPGKTVRIDTPCLDCGESICVEVKDGVIVLAEPDTIIGHVSVPFKGWIKDIAYS